MKPVDVQRQRARLTILASLMALFGAALVLAPPLAAQGGPPPFPFIVKGDVFIGGVPAPIGRSVTAEIAGVTVASTTVTTLGKFLMAVASGSDGDGVNFRIDGVLAPQTTVFETGVTTALDLTVPAPEPVPGLTAYGLLITGALLALAIARRGQWNSSKPHNAH